MENKVAFLLFLLQLWHFAMPNTTVLIPVDDLSQLNESNQTIRDMQPFTCSKSNFPIQIGNKFYHVETNLRANWYEAAQNCRQLGGHLLNIESSKEMDAILSIVPICSYWTSGNCLAKLGDWMSVSTGEAMPYLRWHLYEPNNEFDNELCVELKETAMNDGFCGFSHFYICEAKII